MSSYRWVTPVKNHTDIIELTFSGTGAFTAKDAIKETGLTPVQVRGAIKNLISLSRAMNPFSGVYVIP